MIFLLLVGVYILETVLTICECVNRQGLVGQLTVPNAVEIQVGTFISYMCAFKVEREVADHGSPCMMVKSILMLGKKKTNNHHNIHAEP